MSGSPVRRWCAKCRFDDREPFILGHVEVRLRAPDHEVRAAIEALAASIFPTQPTIIALTPGALMFQPEEA